MICNVKFLINRVLPLLMLVPVVTAVVFAFAAEAQATQAFPMYSWGTNAHGQLGLGHTTAQNTPQRVGTAVNWVHVSSSSGGGFALNTEGHLYGWGNTWNEPNMAKGGGERCTTTGNIVCSTSGDIMVPAANLRSLATVRIVSPTRIGSESNWTYVSARGTSVVALNSEGHLYTWGWNAFGQLGHGDTNDLSTPERVPGYWKAASSGNRHMLAIRNDGTIWAWGDNAQGQLGGSWGSTSNIPVPVIPEKNDWVSVIAGPDTSMAIDSNGALWSWGFNGSGRLGRASASTRLITPGQVVNITSPVVSVTQTSGNMTVAAVTADGHLYTWGDNTWGKLGIGTTGGNRNAPVRVGDADNWVSVMGGNSHILAFNEDRELLAWGRGYEGQLGLGGWSSRHEPYLVAVVDRFSSAASGGGHFSIMLIQIDPIQGGSFLTKRLQKPEGTPIPNASFTFTFERNSHNDRPADAHLLPEIPNRVVTIDPATAATAGGITTTIGSTDVLEGISFNRTGVFSYIVREVSGSSTTTPPSTMVYSQAEYELRVYVTQPGGIGSDFEIDAITIHRRIDTDGNIVAPPEKVAELSFLNTYTRTSALTISKDVVGYYANLDTAFIFDVILTATALCADDTVFVGRIYNEDNSFNRSYNFDSAVLRQIQLLHGQRLVLESLVVGTNFNATEAAHPEFIASVNLVVNGVPIDIAGNTNPNAELTTGNRTVGAGSNTAAFVNTHTDIPPTGFMINQFPLFLPAMAALALALLAVSRRRKAIEQMPAAYH